MAVVFDQKSESGFVFGSVLEFIKCWEAGSDSRLVLETINGGEWVNFSCCLGRPNASHVVLKRPKSPRKEYKDNLRAAAHNEKVREQSCFEEESGDITSDVSVESIDVQDDAVTAETETVYKDGVLECKVDLYAHDFEPNDVTMLDARKVIERTVLSHIRTFGEDFGIEVKNLDSDDVQVEMKGDKVYKLTQSIKVNYRQKQIGIRNDFSKVYKEKAISGECRCFIAKAVLEGENLKMDSDGELEIYAK